jgi:hypothetical protein
MQVGVDETLKQSPPGCADGAPTGWCPVDLAPDDAREEVVIFGKERSL